MQGEQKTKKEKLKEAWGERERELKITEGDGLKKNKRERDNELQESVGKKVSQELKRRK